MFPGQFRNVHQTVDSTEIHECTDVDNRGNGTGTDLALLQCLQEVGASFGLCLFHPSTAGQDNVVTVLIQFNDFGFELLPDVWCQVADTTHLNQGRGQEPT